MFPLNDIHPNRYASFSFITLIIITVNVIILSIQFVLLETNTTAYLDFIYRYGSVPQRIWQGESGAVYTAVTATFLHGDIIHLGSNMLAMWVFGRRVEDACGHGRFLLYYLTCGVTATLFSAIINANSDIPSIGASGAVFGMMGAYLILFPWGRIRTFVPILFLPTFPRLRAIWVILYFLGIQIIPAIGILTNQTDVNIDYWAHIGGFFGCLLIFFFLRPEALHRYRANLPV